MALQVKLTNRRQFLGRSALGAGSLLFGPLLLESCTDHNIPPDKPINPPLFGDDESIDWNNDAKNAVTTGLQLVPEVGGFISSLVSIFWPSSGPSVWDQIKGQVEQLVDQKLDDALYKQVTADLDGLKNQIDKFKEAIKDFNEDPTNTSNINNIQSNFGYLDDAFSGAVTHFKLDNDNSDDNDVLLLPLFAQFANLYLSLLRDGALHGAEWGRSKQLQSDTYADLQKAISEYASYTATTYKKGYDKIYNSKTQDDLLNEPFTSTNTYARQMTLTVLDYMDTWQYYDANIYGNGVKGFVNQDGTPLYLFTREIYSDPVGNTQDNDTNFNDPIVLPPPPAWFPTQLTVWAGSRIDAVQLTYNQGWGPGGVTTTPRMGDQSGGTNQPPVGGTFDLVKSPITAVAVSYGFYPGADEAAITTLRFGFYDRTTSQQMGQQDGGGQVSAVINYPNMILSSIYVHGYNELYGNTADCMVFGFKRWPQ